MGILNPVAGAVKTAFFKHFPGHFHSVNAHPGTRWGQSNDLELNSLKFSIICLGTTTKGAGFNSHASCSWFGVASPQCSDPRNVPSGDLGSNCYTPAGSSFGPQPVPSGPLGTKAEEAAVEVEMIPVAPKPGEAPKLDDAATSQPWGSFALTQQSVSPIWLRHNLAFPPSPLYFVYASNLFHFSSTATLPSFVGCSSDLPSKRQFGRHNCAVLALDAPGRVQHPCFWLQILGADPKGRVGAKPPDVPPAPSLKGGANERSEACPLGMKGANESRCESTSILTGLTPRAWGTTP